MALPLSIPTLIAEAKIAQYLWANDVSKGKIFHGTNTPNYSQLLYVVRKLVEWKYANNPTDPSLIDTGNYLYSLIGKYKGKADALYAGSGCVAPVIISNPLSQTVGAGGSVTFVTVATGSNLTYQWQYNSVDIPTATNSYYTKSGLVSGDAGNYRCVVTNTCGSANTLQAVLTVGAGDVVGYYYFGSTDYFAALNGGTDAVTYNATFPIVNGQPLSVPFPIGASNNVFNIVKYPITQGLKTGFDNQTPNIGPIPGDVYHSIVTIGSFYYIISSVEMSLNPDFPVIYT